MRPGKWLRAQNCESNACVEVGVWRKSTRSGPWTDNCVEVTGTPEDQILVRNSNDPDGPVVAFTPDEWNAFIDGVKAGEFDLSEKETVS